jgi:hypothetical protein
VHSRDAEKAVGELMAAETSGRNAAARAMKQFKNLGETKTGAVSRPALESFSPHLWDTVPNWWPFRLLKIAAESLTETQEVATARWFGAPELRNGHLDNPTAAADIYSLGKLLYWLFTGRVYDRDEQEYETEDRKLSNVLAQVGINPKWGS